MNLRRMTAARCVPGGMYIPVSQGDRKRKVCKQDTAPIFAVINDQTILTGLHSDLATTATLSRFYLSGDGGGYGALHGLIPAARARLLLEPGMLRFA